jgi:hypothetical protein
MIWDTFTRLSSERTFFGRGPSLRVRVRNRPMIVKSIGVPITTEEAKETMKIRPDTGFKVMNEMSHCVARHREPEPTITKLDHIET